MKALGTFPTRHPSPWRSPVVQRFRSWLMARRASGSLPDEPAIGPREVEALERALLEWVRLQKAESKPVPTHRIDCD